MLRGEEDWRFGNPWLERGETLGLSNVEDDADIVGGAVAEEWKWKERMDIRMNPKPRRGKKHWLFTSKQRLG